MQKTAPPEEPKEPTAGMVDTVDEWISRHMAKAPTWGDLAVGQRELLRSVFRPHLGQVVTPAYSAAGGPSGRLGGVNRTGEDAAHDDGTDPEVRTELARLLVPADAVAAAGRLRGDARLLVIAEEAFGRPRARQAEHELLCSKMEAMTTERRDQRLEELRNELRRRLGSEGRTRVR